MKQLKRCPVGIQTFWEIRERDMLYVDKTGYIYEFAHEFKYVFLSRPRRFGKSLLTSTIECYFEGHRDLFQGLAIEQLEKEWRAHPVLHFDMSTAKHLDKEGLEQELSGKLTDYEEIYGKGEADQSKLNQRLMGLIKRAYRQTGQKVVVLIDEYDAPLLDVAHRDGVLDELRQVMRNFYSPLKACDPYLRFVFLTGITKFSQTSIFSELNNLKNISMLPQYAAVCGISTDELLTQMGDYVEAMADALNKSFDETVDVLKGEYDGYHFTWPSPDIFNPFSLLNALQDKALNSYWFQSGTPTFLIEMMRKYQVMPSELDVKQLSAAAFDVPIEQGRTITPLLYQSGYFTIKGYDSEMRIYTLDIPNKEIRIGLFESLAPYYLGDNEMNFTVISRLWKAMSEGRMEDMLRLLQQFLLTVPQCDNTNYEGHYQQVLYIIFSLLGAYVDVEVRTATGRVDVVMRTADRLYLFELKLNRSADEAMEQILVKDYPSRFSLTGLPIVKVGINFDSERHTLKDWKIEE